MRIFLLYIWMMWWVVVFCIVIIVVVIYVSVIGGGFMGVVCIIIWIYIGCGLVLVIEK